MENTEVESCMEKRSVPADDTGDDESMTSGEKLLARAALGGVLLLAVVPVGLIFLLILLVTAAIFPRAIELDGIAPIFWALLLLAPCSAIAMAITVPVRHLVRGAFNTSPAVGKGAEAAFSWVTYLLVGLMLLAWTPGVHAHSMTPALAVATAGLVFGLLAERLGIGSGKDVHK
ncbi:hypothetical protein [Streptomyces sp. HUAS TT20]|uniref:hypothetical protein n=1 Tax=Streptomyces sp. HUAS TT20 TaxID=3447509 RepID=UPI0021DAB96E|nr:hypothetical protein [Streptomyces sp. HUAS 15-9]UXY28208.1 hypothetical protein N8I87_17595 [Streptomyces sp. HUAS 15-9]